MRFNGCDGIGLRRGLRPGRHRRPVQLQPRQRGRLHPALHRRPAAHGAGALQPERRRPPRGQPVALLAAARLHLRRPPLPQQHVVGRRLSWGCSAAPPARCSTRPASSCATTSSTPPPAAGRRRSAAARPARTTCSSACRQRARAAVSADPLSGDPARRGRGRIAVGRGFRLRPAPPPRGAGTRCAGSPRARLLRPAGSGAARDRLLTAVAPAAAGKCGLWAPTWRPRHGFRAPKVCVICPPGNAAPTRGNNPLRGQSRGGIMAMLVDGISGQGAAAMRELRSPCADARRGLQRSCRARRRPHALRGLRRTTRRFEPTEPHDRALRRWLRADRGRHADPPMTPSHDAPLRPKDPARSTRSRCPRCLGRRPARVFGFNLRAGPLAASEARHAFSAAEESLGRGRAPAVLLMLTELVTNAVRHGEGAERPRGVAVKVVESRRRRGCRGDQSRAPASTGTAARATTRSSRAATAWCSWTACRAAGASTAPPAPPRSGSSWTAGPTERPALSPR